MSTDEQMEIELAQYENELARIASVEGLNPVVEALVDSVSANMAVLRENLDSVTWLDVRSWIFSTRFGIYTTIGAANLQKMLDLGMRL